MAADELLQTGQSSATSQYCDRSLLLPDMTNGLQQFFAEFDPVWLSGDMSSTYIYTCHIAASVLLCMLAVASFHDSTVPLCSGAVHQNLENLPSCQQEMIEG